MRTETLQGLGRLKTLLSTRNFKNEFIQNLKEYGTQKGILKTIEMIEKIEDRTVRQNAILDAFYKIKPIAEISNDRALTLTEIEDFKALLSYTKYWVS